MSKENLQKNYIELQLLENQLQQITQQLGIIEQHINELMMVEEGLDNLKDVKNGNELLIPLGSGIFINGNIESSNEILLNVGAGVVVKKSREEVKSIVTKQLESTKEVFVNLENEASNILERQAILKEELNTLNK